MSYEGITHQQTYRQLDIQTERHTYIQTDRQTDRQTEIKYYQLASYPFNLDWKKHTFKFLMKPDKKAGFRGSIWILLTKSEVDNILRHSFINKLKPALNSKDEYKSRTLKLKFWVECWLSYLVDYFSIKFRFELFVYFLGILLLCLVLIGIYLPGMFCLNLTLYNSTPIYVYSVLSNLVMINSAFNLR